MGAPAAIALAFSLPGCGGGPKEMKSPPGPSGVGRTLKPSDDVVIIGKRKESLSRRERVKLLRERRAKQAEQ